MLLRAAQYPVNRWKNGGGVTREIAASPAGAGMEDFDWRISMATVAQDGPFSTFPGIDRTLFLLDGDGMVLRFESTDEVFLAAGDMHGPFAADIPTDARLTGGEITDLNIMTRRGRVSHRARYRRIEGSAHITPQQCTLAVFGVDGALKVAQGDDLLDLYPRDCLILKQGMADAKLQGTGTVIQAEFAGLT